MAFDLKALPNRVYRFFANLRTGIVLLIVVGIAAALGTFILQRPITEPDRLARAYSPTVLLWLDRLTLTDVYHSWWFNGLLILVSVSIVLVSIDRFPNAWRYYSRPYRKTDSHFRSALPNKVELPIKDANEALNAAERALKDLNWPVERIADRTEPALYSERHRFSVMAVYIIHSSLLIIFLGAIIDGFWGFSGFMALGKGQTSNQIELRTGSKKQLPFSVKCYSAGEETYSDGSPKRWWSKLAVVDDGKETGVKEIAVNDPLDHRGVRFFQASFGNTGKLDALKVLATAEGRSASELSLAPGAPVELDPANRVTLAEYIPDFFVRDNQVFKKSDDPVNPAFRLQVNNKNTEKESTLWLFPAYNQAAQGDSAGYKFEFRDMEMGYFTGLEASYKPGQWLVWVGVLIMVAGLGVAFYMVHMRLWVAAVHDSSGKLVLWIGGQSNKNRDRFEQKFEEVVSSIKDELKNTSARPRSAQEGEPAFTLAGVK